MDSEFSDDKTMAERPDGENAITAVSDEMSKMRAVQEIQAALVIGKKFPRDEISAEQNILTACKRFGLAEKATYSYPRAGQKISGPSIRLAEVLAMSWGNLKYGFRELEQIKGASIIEAFCWDVQTNTHVSRQFTVHHFMQLKEGRKKILTDPRDIYEMCANYAQRRVRAAILELIPGDVVEKALRQCRATLEVGEKAEPLIDRIKRVVNAFGSLSVTKEMLEKRLGHGAETINVAEIADLQEIYNSIKDGQSKREDWFALRIESSDEALDELNKKLGAKE